MSAPGTTEDTWRAWDRRFRPFDLAGCRTFVVVAPHPDDEVLGVGGVLASAVAAGIDVHVVAVTDGGASHPGSPTMSAAQLIRLRPAEALCALAELGVPTIPRRLALPDGALARHEADIADALVPLLTADPAHTWCLVTWRGDGHPDHEACGRAAAVACARSGARLWEYPVWMWHWARPEDPDVPWHAAHTLELSPGLHAAKRLAAEHFHTQIRSLSTDPRDQPILPAHVLARLLRSRETVFG